MKQERDALLIIPAADAIALAAFFVSVSSRIADLAVTEKAILLHKLQPLGNLTLQPAY